MALKNSCFGLMNTPTSCTPATTVKSNLTIPFPTRINHNSPTSSQSFKCKSSTISSLSFGANRNRSGNSRVVCKASEAINSVQVVTDSTWDNLVIGCNNPVLVEFWAPWCGPCRMIAPVVDELAKEYSGKISCLKLNTDDCPTIATKYGIRSIPTVLFFKNGERKESIIGAVPKTTLASSIEKYLDA